MFVTEYVEKKTVKDNQFQVLDQESVGRHTTLSLKLCISAEYGGEPSLIDFCYRQRCDFVSCSPYRVSIA